MRIDLEIKGNRLTYFAELMALRESLLRFDTLSQDFTGYDYRNDKGQLIQVTLYSQTIKKEQGKVVDFNEIFSKFKSDNEEDEYLDYLENFHANHISVACKELSIKILEDCGGYDGIRFIGSQLGFKDSDTPPEKPVFFNSRFFIISPINWDKELNDQGVRFFKEYGHYPNILQASNATYEQIEFIAARNREHIKGERETPEHGVIELSGFEGQGFSLDFCIDESLSLWELNLIYDSDPGGEEDIDQKEKGPIRKAS